MTNHGKLCDFSFYVTSLDTQRHYAEVGAPAKELSLLQAVSEFYKQCGENPPTVNTMLGVEYRTDHKELDPIGIGAADLLQRVNGQLIMPKDYERSEILSQEKLISVNAVSFLRQQRERFYEMSDKYTIECAKALSAKLPEIAENQEKCVEVMSQLAGEYGAERCRVILANETYGNASQLLSPETADYLEEVRDKYDDRFRINATPQALEQLTNALRSLEGLSETETKLYHAGLVNGDSRQVRSESEQVKTEIEHHNTLENQGLVSEDQWSL